MYFLTLHPSAPTSACYYSSIHTRHQPHFIRGDARRPTQHRSTPGHPSHRATPHPPSATSQLIGAHASHNDPSRRSLRRHPTARTPCPAHIPPRPPTLPLLPPADHPSHHQHDSHPSAMSATVFALAYVGALSGIRYLTRRKKVVVAACRWCNFFEDVCACALLPAIPSLADDKDTATVARDRVPAVARASDERSCSAGHGEGVAEFACGVYCG